MHWGLQMATKKVILYFDNQQDALRFTLAAGSLMTGSEQEEEARRQALHLVSPLKAATRIRVGRTSSREEGQEPAAKAG